MESNLRVCASPFCDKEFTPETHNQKYHSPKCKRDVENINRRRATPTQTQLSQEAELISIEAGVEDQIAYLRQVNQRLLRENLKLKIVAKEVNAAVYTAVKDHLVHNPFKPVAEPRKIKSATKESAEHCINVLSDWQLGKKTLTYDISECEKVIDKYQDKVLRITDLQRKDHPVTKLHAWWIGDMVEGESIFPGQSYHLDASLYTQIMRTADIGVKYLRRMLNYFDTIDFVGVPGNHGAIHARDAMHPDTNADRIVYSTIQMVLADEKRITWDIASEEYEGDFYTIKSIGDKDYMLMHGHKIRGSGKLNTIENKLVRWMTAIPHFDYALMGHFHTPTRMSINNRIVYINGTTESNNGWAVEVLGAIGRPCQYLLYAHPEHGITAEYPLYLDY